MELRLERAWDSSVYENPCVNRPTLFISRGRRRLVTHVDLTYSSGLRWLQILSSFLSMVCITLVLGRYMTWSVSRRKKLHVRGFSIVAVACIQERWLSIAEKLTGECTTVLERDGILAVYSGN